MEELLTRYGIADILIFCAVLAAAVKGLITFWDWLWGRIKQVTDRDYAEENERKVLEKKVGSLEAFYAEREKVDSRKLKSPGVSNSVMGNESTSVGRSICRNCRFISCIWELSVIKRLTWTS